MSGNRYLRLVPPAAQGCPGLADVLRTLVTGVVGITVTGGFGAAIIAVAAVRPNSPLIDRVLRAWAGAILTVSGVRVETLGTDKIDPEQAYVIIANHRSAFDLVCPYIALPMPIRFLAKQELLSIPIFGAILRSLRTVPVDRATADHASINDAATAVLGSGYSLVVFAEGTRAASAEPRPFKKGGFVIAQRNGIPILPVTIIGTGDILPPGGRMIRKAAVTVIIGDPIPPELAASRSIDELASTTRTIVLDNERQWSPDAPT